MPLYEYVCRKRQEKFSAALTVQEHDTKRVRGPKCKSEGADHVTEAFFAPTSSKTHGW